jgi:VWFA-related protein
MFNQCVNKTLQGKCGNWRARFVSLFCGLALLAGAVPSWAQTQQNPPTPSPAPAQTQDNGKPKQEVPAEAGGPDSNMGPYTIPKKKDDAVPPPPPPVTAKKVEGLPDYSLKVNVPLVNVDVLVTTKDGQFIPGLKQGNFRILEDGVPQAVTNFNVSPAPITAVLLTEFASTSYFFLIDALNASYSFANTLKKDDWVAVEYYDMQPHILVDFTQDKRAVMGALNQLRMPGFAETNLFDALYDTLDRLERIEGKKYIILVTTGVDTFSKLTLDKMMKKIKDTKDITIFPVSIGWAIREYCETHSSYYCRDLHGMGIPVGHMDYLQADNEMKTFAAMTGGRAFFPRFQAEFNEIFQQIGEDIRKQYSLSYHPTNTKLDGTYRKLKVQVVGPDGAPLKVRDQKGKDVKIDVVARDGYTAKHTVD